MPPATAAGETPLRPLAVPVQGVLADQLQDTFHAARGSIRRHEALDIGAPRGRPVYAADDGTLVKLFTSRPGGLTVYQFDPTRRVAYYYAHLDRYAGGLREGQTLKRCDLIGYVGSTGNAAPDAPHLHFAVFRLGALRQWWIGTALDPLPALRAGAAAGLACGR
ncbi:MAG: M23 family metallopeptidase [Burkholderiaceae bacterium]